MFGKAKKGKRKMKKFMRDLEAGFDYANMKTPNLEAEQ